MAQSPKTASSSAIPPPTWKPAAGLYQALRRLFDPAFDLKREAVEDTTSGAPPLPLPPPEAAPTGEVTAVRYGWNSVDVDVTARGPCLLVLCDTWHPGWTVRVDGETRPISRVNAVFRGVPLRSGDKRAAFTYEPASFRVGAFGRLGVRNPEPYDRVAVLRHNPGGPGAQHRGYVRIRDGFTILSLKPVARKNRMS